jgi:hypothetical protein
MDGHTKARESDSLVELMDRQQNAAIGGHYTRCGNVLLDPGGGQLISLVGERAVGGPLKPPISGESPRRLSAGAASKCLHGSRRGSPHAGAG